jgi:6-phosphogluconolactonase
MAEPAISVYSNLEELSRAAAESFVETANARIAETGNFFVALSGGATPRRMYDLLGTSAYSDRIYWANIHLFQVDERCVAPDHRESNFKMIREALLAPVRMPRGSFHRIAGEQDDPAAAAHLYALELARVIPVREGGFPRFDLIFLGMGADGHTASLFPESAVLDEKQSWTCPSPPGPNGLKRVTLTLPVLNAAAQIVFLVAGAEKAETLGRVLEGPPQARLLPAQAIKPPNGRVSWYVDQAAASRLQITTRSHR